jgi:hypothetical protein
MNIERRFEKLEPHLKQAFMNIVSKLQRREKLEIPDFMSLFESHILTALEKQKIIETFMPSISIADAVNLGILDVISSTAIKKQALEKSLDVGSFTKVNLDSYIS